MGKNELTLTDVAATLRSMLDDEQAKNELLWKRNKELELLLMQNGISIPDYDLWHGGILPMI